MKPNAECVICGKQIYRIPSRKTDHPLCSYACRNKYFSQERSFVWKGGPEVYKKAHSRQIRIREKMRRILYKEVSIKLLGGCCNLCGYNKCIAALEFHHKDPMMKDATVKNIISGSWEKIQEEIKKCVLLCANCHRENHYKEVDENDRRAYQEVSKSLPNSLSRLLQLPK